MAQKKNNYNKNNYRNNNYNHSHNHNQSRKRDYVKDNRDTVAKEITREINHNSTLEKGESQKKKKHPIVNFFLFLTLVSSLAYFGITLWKGLNSVNFFRSLISSVLLVIFSILFIAICVTNPNRKKGTIFLGSFFLLLFNLFGGLTTLGIVSVPSIGQVADFQGKSLTEVVRWAEKNDITLNQDYEYSDMVPAYSIISQDMEQGTKVKDINELTVSVSEGPNPDKEIIVPEMNGWDTERVINYVEDNYLNNVEVSFRESISPQDTVIEQSDSGSMRRSEKLELTFSLGEEADTSDVKLVDLTDMSEFAATLYLKQHQIKYEIKKDFSNKIERGNVSKQSIQPNTMVKVNNDEDKLTLTISKGKSIKVPNLKDMSMVEITNWVIENKLKLEFTNQYDDSIKENSVISANYDKGDKIEQGSTVKVVISKGKLVMEKFKSLDEFKAWADKYGIAYEEKHEFSEDVPQGEVISYSHKKGDTIKNGDSIIITISDGKECKVPDVVGMSKKEAIEALEDAGLNYNFVTQSSSKSKNTVIKQSISAGSKVSSGTTITITISSGKQTEYREDNSSSSHSSSSGSSSSGSSNSSSSGGSSNPTPAPTPTCDKSITTTVWIYPDLISNDPNTTCNNIKNKYSSVHFSCSYVSNGPGIGLVVNSDDIDGHELNHCDTYVLKINKG